MTTYEIAAIAIVIIAMVFTIWFALSVRKSVEKLSQKEVENISDLIKKGLFGLSTQEAGRLGEQKLAEVLESLGFMEQRDFLPQYSKGSLRPDVILKLPQNFALIIDSKVNFTDIQSIFTLEERQNISKIIYKIYKKTDDTIKALAKKRYQQINGFKMLEYVVMFIPNDSVFALLLHFHPDIFQKALENKIILASPSTLGEHIAFIRILWKNVNICANFSDIGTNVEILQSSISTLEDSLEKARKELGKTQTQLYDSHYYLDRLQTLCKTKKEELPKCLSQKPKRYIEKKRQISVFKETGCL